MNVSRLALGLSVLVSIWGTTQIVKAAPITPTAPGVATSQGDNIPGLDDEQEQKVDAIQDEASAMLLGAAEWIDSFFDDGRSSLEDNQTRATIKLSTAYSRKNDFEIKPRFSLRLKLPRLSSKAMLIIQAADDEDFDYESNPLNNSSTSHENSKYDDLTVGIRHFLKETENYNISFNGGVSWDYLYAGVRFRALHEFYDWQGRFTNRLRYYTDDGWENSASYDLETDVGDNFFFRTTTSVILSEDEEGVPHGQYFKLFQVLSEYQALSYETGIYLNNEPEYQLTDLQFKVRYRQRFYRDWLVFEISPKVTFPEEDDYEINPGIELKLEATIGYQTDKDVYKHIFRK